MANQGYGQTNQDHLDNTDLPMNQQTAGAGGNTAQPGNLNADIDDVGPQGGRSTIGATQGDYSTTGSYVGNSGQAGGTWDQPMPGMGSDAGQPGMGTNTIDPNTGMPTQPGMGTNAIDPNTGMPSGQYPPADSSMGQGQGWASGSYNQPSGVQGGMGTSAPDPNTMPDTGPFSQNVGGSRDADLAAGPANTGYDYGQVPGGVGADLNQDEGGAGRGAGNLPGPLTEGYDRDVGAQAIPDDVGQRRGTIANAPAGPAGDLVEDPQGNTLGGLESDRPEEDAQWRKS